jgi:SAM-dependent methyltransferase
MIAQVARRLAGRLRCEQLESFAEWQAYCAAAEDRHERIARDDAALLSEPLPAVRAGWCHVCRRPSRFTCSSGNLREDLVCAGCGLINRLRASLWLLESECAPGPSARIYVTEQVTALYQVLAARYPGIVGSEYLGEHVALGASVDGIRNESVTGLTFDTGSLSHVLSFEVFEHVPDYRRAFAECARVLRPGGSLLFSVPFLRDAPQTLVRARVLADGTVEHLLEPEYHGDPLSSDGCLCYQHFGWDMLDDLRQAGFSRAVACVYWSKRFAYLGGEQIQFVAVR